MLCGLLLGEVDLVRAGILAAAMPCTAALVVQRSRVRIGNRRSIEPTRVSAGDAVSIHLVISNKSLLRTGTLMVEDQLPERLIGHARFVLDPLGSHESRTVSYRIPGLGRGRYRVGPLRIRLTDPFRMIDLSRSFTATSDFIVGPVVDALPAVEPPRSDELGDNAGSHSVGAYGADDQSTREYRTGDDLRKIHWRSSARTGALMVRQEERPWRGQSTLLLDLRSAGHVTAGGHPIAGVDPRQTSSLEWAVSAAASIGNHVLMRGRELTLLADPSSDRLRFANPLSLTHHLAGVRESGHPDLGAMAAPIRSAARDSSLIAVIARLDPATLRTLADAHPRGRSSPAVALLLDVDTWRGADPDGLRRTDVSAGAAVLRNAGWRVTVVPHGPSTAEAWQVLLAGFTSAARTSAALR